MKDWHKLKPELFKKNPYYLTGCDRYAKLKNIIWFSKLERDHLHIKTRIEWVFCDV
jgi:hypothetical protein